MEGLNLLFHGHSVKPGFSCTPVADSVHTGSFQTWEQSLLPEEHGKAS